LNVIETTKLCEPEVEVHAWKTLDLQAFARSVHFRLAALTRGHEKKTARRLNPGIKFRSQ